MWALVGLGLTLAFGFGVKGLGGVLSIRASTSSRVGSLDMKLTPEGEVDDDLRDFGRIVLIWGQIEALLAGFVLAVNHPKFNLRDNGGVRSQFSQKKKRILEGLYAIKQIQPMKAEIEEEMEALSVLHDKRSTIVHGAYQGFTGTGHYLFIIYESRDDQQKRWMFPTFTPEEVHQLTEDLRHHRDKLEKMAGEALHLMHS